ncbi:hypothetical protein [Chryseobacterium sp. NKUCC03_KSP]|jgi:hypothetical protein|uniref:hypothetical protein n=1 Tax=Chryseobacterium sp. NKUCC03_KSP TaxID=2842125 RepID=UPI001C5A65D0|nr:hypothetical protein [Chryseobacterium sp. NKUCC03_KSP]MBW3524649.1 hypothetical protein [Chryseobacterium sp. NKUCC03_KSP]
MKSYFGIIFSAIYALTFRVLVEFNVLDINSWTYIILVPFVMGYIPFMFDKKAFMESRLKSVFFPLLSVTLFLFIAFITRLEDLGCFIILFPPYVFFSIVLSIIFRYILNAEDSQNSNKIKRNGLVFLVIPILLGNVENYFDKKESKLIVYQKIFIKAPKEKVWKNLFSVPDLTHYIDRSTFNYFGFPNPVRSEYNEKTNVRLGYFSNGIILNESVVGSKPFEELSFKINVEGSNLESSQTFDHILKNKNLVFNTITYKLQSVDENTTELTLVCDYKVRSNLPFYGEFWSENIILDFENKLLKALKKQNETQVK